MAFLLIFAVLVAAILLPEPAAAWGPTTHLLIGKQVLDIISANGLSIAPLIAANPLDFLYGSIFADMSLGKKFFFFARLAHNWRVGFRLLEKSSTDKNRSCAYGYLAHLAADTIAHNEFIPGKLVEHYSQKRLGHIFFETAFDGMLPYDPSHESEEIVRAGSANNDAFLEASLSRTLFSFKTNRRLYRGILTVNRNNSVIAFRRWRARNIKAVKQIDVSENLIKCTDAVIDFLKLERAAACYAIDPHGKDALKSAAKLRKSLRQKMRKEKLSHRQIREALAGLHRK